MTKDQKFYQALQEVFIAISIEDQHGLVNLMRIKSDYENITEELLKDFSRMSLNLNNSSILEITVIGKL